MKKNLFAGSGEFNHRMEQPLGVLLVNLGTPDAPTPEALRPYLKKFLSDPRVIEYARIPWWIILNLFILPTRPKKSAALYEKIWMPEGSPLLVYSKRQAEKLATRLKRELPVPVVVELGMRIGNPSLEDAMQRLRAAKVKQLLVLPMFPQFSSTTTGSVFDGVTEELRTWRWIPELRMVMSYHDDPGYIDALAASVNELWSRDGKPDKLVMSFHGMPERYFRDGDPYFCHCHKTARLLSERLGLGKDDFVITFQSLFGREEWLKPYTDDTLKELAKSGVKNVDVVCPAFSVDCLETLEEIKVASSEVFHEAGGSRFRYIPALNDRDDFIDAAAGIVRRHIQGWTVREGSEEARERRVNEVRARSGR